MKKREIREFYYCCGCAGEKDSDLTNGGCRGDGDKCIGMSYNLDRGEWNFKV